MSLRNRNQNNIFRNENKTNFYSSPKLIAIDDNDEQTESLIEKNEYHSTPNLHPNTLPLATTDNSYISLLNNFIASLYNNISTFWTLLNCSSPNPSSSNHSPLPSLTLYQEEKLSQFKKFVTKAYDVTNDYHENQLKKYWNILSNGEELTERKSEQWKKLGFQGKDPASDFRGAGLFGLQNLLYFSARFPSMFHSTFRGDKKREGQQSYPFSIAALNITMMLFEFIGWGIKSSKKNPRAKQNFLSLLFKPDRPFADLIQFSPSSPLPSNDNYDDDDEDEDDDDLNDLIGDLSWINKSNKKIKEEKEEEEEDDNNNNNNNNGNDLYDNSVEEKIRKGDHHTKNLIYFGDNSVEEEYEEELNQSLNIYSEIYCITFHLLEEEWYSRDNVSYFDFPFVLEATSDKLSSLLCRFTSIADVYLYSSKFA